MKEMYMGQTLSDPKLREDIDSVKESLDQLNGTISDAYNSGKTYTVGEYCIYNNVLWKCLVQNEDTVPEVGTYWERVMLTDIILNNENAISRIPILSTKYERSFTRHSDKQVGLSVGGYYSAGIWAALIITTNWSTLGDSYSVFIVYGLQHRAFLHINKIAGGDNGPSAEIIDGIVVVTFRDNNGGGYAVLPLYN